MHPHEVLLARSFSWIFKGSRYTCNICGFRSRKLRWRGHTHPVLKEKNVTSAGRRRSDCPRCLSSDRDRLLWLYLEHTISTKKRILHVAPELPLAHAIKKQLAKGSFTYHCIDKRIKGYNYPHWVINGDITDLKYPDQHFDLIIANHVLEHIIDLESALSELARVLTIDGDAIFMVPLSKSHLTDEGTSKKNGKWICELSKNDKLNRFGQHDHVRLFGTDFESILNTHGWQITRINPNDLSCNEKHIELLCLFPYEDILLARKCQPA